MNMKKKIREFFTLTRSANGGFTLVELIVVIAILAILAGVAVPAYSAYVTRANKQADIILASDIKNALELQFYSTPGFTGVASVAITEDGIEASDGFGTTAMDNAFGSSWSTQTLKYDGWPSGATATAEVLNHFVDSVGEGTATAGVYSGDVHATFEDDIEDLFVMVEDTATAIFQEESATSVKAAATTTMGKGAAEFAAKWAQKVAWGSYLGDNVADAAAVKARNTAIAGYVRNYMKSNVAGIGDEELNAIYNVLSNYTGTSSIIPADVVAEYNNKSSTLGIAISNCLNVAKYGAVPQGINKYFSEGIAEVDGLAYYAMMETVDAVDGTDLSTDDYWDSMSDAIGTYASIARGEVDLNSIASAYEILNEVDGSAVIVLLTAKDGAYTVKTTPEINP